MILRHIFGSGLLGLLLCIQLTLLANAKDPIITKIDFENAPRRFFYFDDSSVILYHERGTVRRSDDDGLTWTPVKGVPADKAELLIEHPFDKKTAFIITDETTHYRTSDRGKSWHKFHVDDPPSLMQTPLVFSADKDDYIIYIGSRCTDSGGWSGFTCRDHAYYTTNGFEKSPKPMVEGIVKCMFARSTEAFKEDSKKGVFCIDVDPESSRNWPENLRLIKSEDWFHTTTVVEMDESKVVRGFIGMGAVQSFIVAAAKSIGTEELALYVTDDGENWDRARFPDDHGGIMEEAYTILPSTKYSIQVDVLSTTSMRNQIGTLFTSNSNGSYFTRSLENTNRNNNGIVDFEKVQNIQGILLANIVANYEEVKANPHTAVKRIESRISFDDGHTWNPLKVGSDNLHLHSESESHNTGTVFSSPAPGVLMGVGNTGDRLKPYADCDFYVSTDAGLTWRHARDGPHQYEFGDQGGILVAVHDEQKADKLYYSFNYGKDWEEYTLGRDVQVRPLFLTTLPDSTSEKFTMLGEKPDGGFSMFALDFEGLRSRKCNLDKKGDGGDFEKWYARVDDEGKPDCLMGHKQFFWRRKEDADCYVGEKYKDPEPIEENCPCTDEDYECDFNFRRVDGKCELVGAEKILSGKCDNEGDIYTTSSGYRKIPGNTCIEPDKNRKDDPVEKECGKEGSEKPRPTTPVGSITHTQKPFSGNNIQYVYLERSETSSGDDETIIMHVGQNKLFISHDGGGDWTPILENEEVVSLYPNPYFRDWVYFVTSDQKVFYTRNRGKDISELAGPSGLPISNLRAVTRFSFHPKHAGWVIWVGDQNCGLSSECHTFAQYTKNAGETWHDLTKYVKECQWIQGIKNDAHESLIYCARYSKQEGDQRDKSGETLQLVSSVDFFDNMEVKFEKIIGFAVLDEYVIVAYADQDEQSLRMAVTVDGLIFANADFPPQFSAARQTAYTVLDSITKSVFLHITTSEERDREYGTIMKSNSNGTYYVTSVDYVNRDSLGYVDFEKVQGLEGVALVNIVANIDEVTKSKDTKKLKSKITHNDGGVWSYLAPPETDSKGDKYSCSGDLEKCSLNLHGYTERKDVRDTYSSGSAVGIMLGVGNVGEYLSPYNEGNTFISADAGATWREVHKGPYTWEFGDQGSIIVVVKDDTPTDQVLYSEDEGRTWKEYKISERPVTVEDIATVPSDTSRKFMVVAKDTDSDKQRYAIQLDFSGLHDRKCVLNVHDPESGDFVLWTPSNPDPDSPKCLFGHEAQYYRRRSDPPAACYVGTKIPQPHRILRNCTCTRVDYECDYNFVRASDGTCQKVGEPIDPMGVCKEEGVNEWFETSGYRKVPLSTCERGLNLDRQPTKSHPCPGKEDQYRQGRSGLHGWALAYVILLTFGMAGVAGYIFWKRCADGRFGQIRLGEGDPSSQPFYIRYPLIAISGIVAAAILLPDAIVSGWKWVRAKLTRQRRFTSRQSFARDGYASLANESFSDAELLDDVEAGEEDL